MADLQRQIIRTIGDPDERYQQDPVRMVRVIRHASRTGFTIENRTYEAILRHREEIKTCSPARVRDEFLRDLREGAARPSLDLMLRTGFLFSIFPDLFRAFGDRNPFRAREIHLSLSLFGLVDQLVKMDKRIPESILVALLVTPLLRSAIPEHPFLGEKERSLYRVQAIRLIVHQLLAPYTFPKGIKEMASQILVAQSYIRKAIDRGSIPKRLRMKKYFQEAAFLYGLEAEAKKEKLSGLLRHAVPSDLLPWWPNESGGARRRHRSNRRKPHPR